MFRCEDGANHDGLPSKQGIFCGRMKPLWLVVKIQWEGTLRETVKGEPGYLSPCLEDREMGQILPTPGGSYSTESLNSIADGPFQGMGRLMRAVSVDTSQSFDIDEYSVYFQLHHDSLGQVITVTLESITEKPQKRSQGGTLLIFLSM